MHDLKANFDKIYQITNSVLSDCLFDGNIKVYRHLLKMTDLEIITLSICQETLAIDSENFFWTKLKTDYSKDFPNLIHITRYNHRRKYLNGHVQRVNAYIVDSMPVPICKNSRENSLKICKENFEKAPDKGYSAVNKQYFIEYKLHLVISIRGVYSSMVLSKASVHDLKYLTDIKHSGLNNCLLLGDRGHLSSSQQIDLFNYAKIDLQTPKRSNQKDYEEYTPIFKHNRKRIDHEVAPKVNNIFTAYRPFINEDKLC